MNIRRIKYKLSCKSLKNYQSKNQNEIDIYVKITAEFLDKVNSIIDKSIRKKEAKLCERRLGKKPMSRYQKHCVYRYMPRREAKKEMINDHAKKSWKYSMIEYVLRSFNQQDKKNRIYSDEELAYIRSLRQNFDWAGFAAEVHDALYEMEL